MLKEIHANFAWLAIIGNGLAGVWSLLAHWIRPMRMRSLWWFAAFAQSLMFIQVGLGVGLVAGEGLRVEGFHMFYGFIALAFVAILFSYRNQMRRWRHLLYGWGSLFLMGLAIRAMSVG